jgi:RNA polymerase sigma factor (sigma-70 family)
MISPPKQRTIGEHQHRIWGLCYRMIGDRVVADDLAQESFARAIERAGAASEETFQGWLYRVATTTCLDWLRRTKRERSAVSLVDPIELADAPFTASETNAEGALLRRDDVRLAVMTSLQALTPRQRAVLVLRDVLDLSTEETADALRIEPGNVKVLLFRARASLEEAHRVGPCDAPVDAAVVERFAVALEMGDLEGLTKLLADDVWGLIDDGLGRRRPTMGARAVGRQWANAFARYGAAAEIRRVRLNAEPALVVIISGDVLSSIHLETRDDRVMSIRVLLDPPRLQRLGISAR